MVLKSRKGYDLREVDPSLHRGMKMSSNEGGMRPDMEQEILSVEIIGREGFLQRQKPKDSFVSDLIVY